MADQQEDPLEHLIELLVYAPIGLLYERDDVLPKLIRRGRSQVQLARLLGQMAVKRGSSDPSAAAGEAATAAAGVVATFITELGAQIGLAPPGDGGEANSEAGASRARPGATNKVRPGADEATDSGSADAPSPGTRLKDESDAAGPVDVGSAAKPRPLPIAGYDSLTAREIVQLLDDLSPEQRTRIRSHEEQGRNRKTVLAKIDRLDP